MDGELATASEKESEVIDPSPAIVTRNLSELFLTGKFQGIRLASFIPDEVILSSFNTVLWKTVSTVAR